jgi:type I restriction enzyme M protein
MHATDDALFEVPRERAQGRAVLAAVIKRARDIMRKDAGLNGDLDRIPQFSWLLFLKAFDAREYAREKITHAADFEPLIESPFRWRDWASAENPKQRVTGEALQEFVNGQLLPYLRKRSGSEELDVIGTIFKDVQNRMLSGNLLREVIDQIDKINFHAAEDIHTMAFIYESMLQEMRDAAGDSGEFYTPRPLIGFMIKMLAPAPGEVMLDPACGTGGFLVEAYEYVRRTHRLSARQLRQLEEDIQGVDKKPLPYLLATMNLLLHGMDRPRVVRDNALNHPIAEQRKNRVGVIATNPPFGGEEEAVVLTSFPADTRTPRTEWLFIQLVIERLKAGGRCGIVVPNNILFDGGLGAKIKAKLLQACNLHTVVRLPNGVFAPYTLIPANLLFFDKTGSTSVTWFYEVPPPAGRRNYTKTKPLLDDDLVELEKWWGGPRREGRVVGPHSWRVPISELVDSGYNLDLRNPNVSNDLAHRPPADLVADIIWAEKDILRILIEISEEIGGHDANSTGSSSA